MAWPKVTFDRQERKVRIASNGSRYAFEVDQDGNMRLPAKVLAEVLGQAHKEIEPLRASLASRTDFERLVRVTNGRTLEETIEGEEHFRIRTPENAIGNVYAVETLESHPFTGLAFKPGSQFAKVWKVQELRYLGYKIDLASKYRAGDFTSYSNRDRDIARLTIQLVDAGFDLLTAGFNGGSLFSHEQFKQAMILAAAYLPMLREQDAGFSLATYALKGEETAPKLKKVDELIYSNNGGGLSESEKLAGLILCAMAPQNGSRTQLIKKIGFHPDAVGGLEINACANFLKAAMLYSGKVLESTEPRSTTLSVPEQVLRQMPDYQNEARMLARIVL